MLRKIVKSKCRRDVVHSKRKERGGKDTIKVTLGFGLAKALSQRQLGDRLRKAREMCFVFCYHIGIHTITGTTIDSGRHKQRVVHIQYIDWICYMHFSNLQWFAQKGRKREERTLDTIKATRILSLATARTTPTW